MWNVREDEPEYAKLKDVNSEAVNIWGNDIDLSEKPGAVIARSMDINSEGYVGENPNRNKQHAFHFTADNCIGCHACEAACSEKNDNPAHISFRSVGYVEGGTFPDFKRMNISMACNHCDDPVCLKGCPTRAYTKHAEYGAVLQDPDTCFGCGYCTWVCPYNAPQLDPVKGQVSKCNMCVDRLEVGLKPSCVSACLGNALNFGVVENTPENREQAKVSIPGFPDPSITNPNIRFQQLKPMPDEVTRTDGMPIKYHKAEDGQYKPKVDPKKGKKRLWSIGKLSSRENPLVLFTLASQASLGLFFSLFLGNLLGVESVQQFVSTSLYVPSIAFSLALVSLGLFMSTVHLGKPNRFYRGFNNLRHSPVCREGLGISVYMTFIGVHAALMLTENTWFAGILQTWGITTLVNFADSKLIESAAMLSGILACVAGAIGLYYMYRCYRIKARPFWDHWQTATSFLGTSLTLGGLLVAVIGGITLAVQDLNYSALLTFAAIIMITGTLMETVGLIVHAKTMDVADHEGAASHYVQQVTFGKSYTLRNVLLVVTTLLLLLSCAGVIAGFAQAVLWSVIAVSCVLTSVIGRTLFYVLVVPTTMPGAFFWKNKDFEQHARDIGLAEMPQVGVALHAH